MKYKKIILTSDHGGFKLKEELKKYFKKHNLEVEDLGVKSEDDKSSYSSKGLEIANKIKRDKNNNELGIAICGTGIGISIAVNRITEVRGARITSIEDAQLARKHNNANILIFGGRQISIQEAISFFEAFENSAFEGGRHIPRIEIMDRKIGESNE